MKMTPYRRGLEAGRAHKAAFDAYSAKCRATHDFEGRPEAPPCPYTVNRSVVAWEDGFRRALRAGGNGR